MHESLPIADLDSLAIRVSNVSKIYRLWESPRDRLMHPLKRVAASLLPICRFKPESPSNGYRDFAALRDVTFEIRKGESWGFIGVNGSGKSTLLRIISGNLRPSAGTVEVEGKVAILDYGSGFNPDFTGRENVYIKGSLLGLSKKLLDERFNAIQDFADIGAFIDQPVKTYSSGMTARLGFAIMVHVDADILITDEALAVGDAFFVQKCMRHMRAFLSRGTFLFVSHSTNDVMSLCKYAVWLEGGKVSRIGMAKDVCQAYLSSIDKRNSGEFLSGSAEVDSNVPNESKDDTEGVEEAPTGGPREKHIRISASQLAALNNYYAVKHMPDTVVSPKVDIRILNSRPGSDPQDALAADGAVGGGRIFQVTVTNEHGGALSSVIGGESIVLLIRAVAERTIPRPIIGFQIKNYTGLTLIAENTYKAASEQNIGLQPGEVISARFQFYMPLIPVGEYVIRAGFADGVEDNNALIDVWHGALLLRCTTSGVRHGIVGAPMTAIEVVRETAPPELTSGGL